MTIILIIALALLAVALFSVALRSRGAARRKVRPVDLNGFHSLLNRDDELFLREKLSRREFSSLKRKRIAVTWRYVRRISDNTAVVLRAVAEARHSTGPEVAQAATQVADLATQIRMQCLIAFGKLAAEYAVPSLQLTPAMLAPAYQSLRENLLRLNSLEPQKMAPLAAAI